MANQPQDLDKLFKERLSQHQVKPSNLAWERLESQLPKKQNPERKIYWWAAAAAILVLIVSYSVFQTSEQTSQPEFVAEKALPNQNPTQEESLNQNESIIEEKVEEASTEEEKVNKPSETMKSQPEPVKKETISNQFTAVNEESSNEKAELSTESKTVEIPEIVVPEVAIDRPLIAEATLEPLVEKETIVEETNETAIEEPAYKVTIISDGIKTEKDKNLIAGIGKRVNQVEGLLGSLDEGFGELQDAKNNLFSSLISKKERTTEKPQ